MSIKTFFNVTSCDNCPFYRYVSCLGYVCFHPYSPDRKLRGKEPLPEYRKDAFPKWCPSVDGKGKVIMNKLKLTSTLGLSATKNILNPEWENIDRVHDWRNYISTPLQGIWSELSLDARIIAYYIAEEIAQQEEWD